MWCLVFRPDQVCEPGRVLLRGDSCVEEPQSCGSALRGLLSREGEQPVVLDLEFFFGLQSSCLEGNIFSLSGLEGNHSQEGM